LAFDLEISGHKASTPVHSTETPAAKKRSCGRLKARQLSRLNEVFDKEGRIGVGRAHQLADELEMSLARVKTWFKTKQKRSRGEQ
jgi:hypothetical protein